MSKLKKTNRLCIEKDINSASQWRSEMGDRGAAAPDATFKGRQIDITTNKNDDRPTDNFGKIICKSK